MRIKTFTVGLLLAGLAVVPSGCSWFAQTPMDILYYTSDEKPPPTNLFVFMRGMGGSHRSFEEEGLVSDVRTMELPFDMAAPNAHFGYYSGRTLLERLKTDLIDPAREQGKDNIWLVGFSMGGLGSLLYLEEHPDDIEGICLVAPFLGYDRILKEIQAAGGVRSWSPGVYDPDEDWERMLWHWIKDNAASESPVPIYLGYGSRDKYNLGHELLAAILPQDRVMRIAGGHDYETFKALWDRFLASGIYRAGK